MLPDFLFVSVAVGGSGGALGAQAGWEQRESSPRRPAAPEGQADLPGPSPQRLPDGAQGSASSLLPRRERRRRGRRWRRPAELALEGGGGGNGDLAALPVPPRCFCCRCLLFLNLPGLLAPSRRREALRARPGLFRGALRHDRRVVQGGVRLPDRPLFGQRADAEHAVPEVCERPARAGVVQAARGQRADHFQGAVRHGGPWGLLRQVRDRQGRHPKPPDPGRVFFCSFFPLFPFIFDCSSRSLVALFLPAAAAPAAFRSHLALSLLGIACSLSPPPISLSRARSLGRHFFHFFSRLFSLWRALSRSTFFSFFSRLFSLWRALFFAHRSPAPLPPPTAETKRKQKRSLPS